MKKKILLSLIPILGVAFILMGFTRETATNPDENISTEEKINWVGIEEAIAAADKDGKKILVDFYTDWCGWCKRMDRDTYAKANIIEYINENYHAVKFDAEGKEPVTIKGTTFNFKANGRRGYHEFAAGALEGRLSYPSTVFFDSKLQRITNVPGYQNAKDMLVILSYLAEDAYRTTSFNEYKAAFK